MAPPRLILASESPRRRALLAEAGYAFDAVSPDVDESAPQGAAPEQIALELACRKARAVAGRNPRGVVLGADTVVALNGATLGKPAGRADAIAMLGRLAGSRHAVLTGVCVLDAATGREQAECVRTWVTMKPMSLDEITAYVDSGEAYGKAGSYAIQETADRYVERVEGSFSNVVGLPIERTAEILAAFGVEPG